MTERLIFIAYQIGDEVTFEDVRKALNHYDLYHVGFRVKELKHKKLMMVHFPKSSNRRKNRQAERLIHRALKDASLDVRSYGVAKLTESKIITLRETKTEEHLHPADRYYFESRRDLFKNISARVSRSIGRIGEREGLDIHAEHRPFAKQGLYDIEVYELFPKWFIDKVGGRFVSSLTTSNLHLLRSEGGKRLEEIKENAVTRAKKRNREMFDEGRVSEVYIETNLDVTKLEEDISKELYDRIVFDGKKFLVANPYRSHPTDNVKVNFEEAAHLVVSDFVTHFLEEVENGSVVTLDSWQRKTYIKKDGHLHCHEEVLLEGEDENDGEVSKSN